MTERLSRERLEEIREDALRCFEDGDYILQEMGQDINALLANIAALEAEIARLRAVVKAAREGCDACHKYNGADYCCDCYHAGSGTHDALAALDEEGEA